MKSSLGRLAAVSTVLAVAVTPAGGPVGAAAPGDPGPITSLLQPQDIICWESQPNTGTGRVAAATVNSCPVHLIVQPPARTPVTVHYRTQERGTPQAGGSATPQLDFVPVTDGVAVIPAGAQEGSAVVQIVSDQIPEPDEAFLIILMLASGAVITDPVAVVTIRNGSG